MSARQVESQIAAVQPRQTTSLFGHREAEMALLNGYRSGRIPHAWLIGGPLGIGKATLAYRMARFVLTHRDPRAPEHDGPPVKQTTGEISQSAKRAPEVTQGPSILIDSDDKPDSLVADLAAAHAAIAAATKRANAVPSKGDAASSSKEMLVSQVRRDAVEFTHEEEAFFNANHSNTNAVPKLESFDDLDEGYEPPKFWDRVFGRKKKPK